MPIIKNRPFSRRNKNKNQVTKSANLSSLFNNTEEYMKSLYADTYLSDRGNLDALNYVAGKMEDNIDAIIRRNDHYDVSSVSKLYSRMMRDTSYNPKSEKELANELESLFSNSSFTDAILGSYLSNRWIADLDREIDTLIRMLPKLAEALDVLKDAVLSADSISKDFVYPKVAISDDTELKVVTDRINKITTKYDLTAQIEEWYDSASKYGETFIYTVPYNKAIANLLARKQQNIANVEMPMIEHGVINEAVIGTMPKNKDTVIPSNCSLDITIDTGRMLKSCVEEYALINKVKRNNRASSLMESYMADVKNGEVIHEKTKIHKVIPNDLEIPDGLNTKDYNATSTSKKDEELNVRGCVVKTLDRKNLIRLYVDDICLGYYYMEFKNKNDAEMNYYMDSERNLSYTKSISTIEKTINDNLEDNRTDHLMRNIARQLSEKLDATFVNANQDLTKEIYAILKYHDIFNSNTSVNISFLPPEDVKWLRFKEDKDLHMGISDINDSIYPAKLFAMLYVTYVVGTLTRGQDKRVYYVKQTIETNIAQTLLNVINQIKKSNFNARSIENLNNLLNITGRFNDYIIPVGPSGDSPIQFEIMPGQEFNINQELMDMLEEMAINPIAPLELIQARMSPDFASQYTTSSLKLIRKTFRRQARMELFISEIYTNIYAAEYEEYQQIDCELPPPIFLSILNTNQLLENTKSFTDIIAEMEYADNTNETVDQEKAIFTRKMIRNRLSVYIRPDEVDKYKKSATFEIELKKKNQQESDDM